MQQRVVGAVSDFEYSIVVKPMAKRQSLKGWLKQPDNRFKINVCLSIFVLIVIGTGAVNLLLAYLLFLFGIEL